MVVSDLDDIFIPLPDDLLVNLSESRTVVDAFLESLPTMFQDNVNVESAFGPALKSAFMIVSQLGGKLLIFQNTLPSLGVGRLRLRGDDIRVYGTDKEHVLRIPEDPFYKQMAADFTKYQIAVNVYAFSDKYTDMASFGTLAKYTGGQVYYYPSFHSAIQKEKLRHELTRDLSRETAWEAVMRERCGKGVRFTSYHGNFMLRSTDLMALPAVDCAKAYAMQLCLEDTLLTTQTVYFQVALLYPLIHGKSHLRGNSSCFLEENGVHIPVSDNSGCYRNIAQCLLLKDSHHLREKGVSESIQRRHQWLQNWERCIVKLIMSLFFRLAIEKSLSYKLEELEILFRKELSKPLESIEISMLCNIVLIFPESLRFFILYGLALCKSAPIRGGYADVQLDERCAARYTMMALPVKRLLKLLYPNLMRIDEYLLQTSLQADEFENVCKRLPLTAENLDSRGLYIYDDGSAKNLLGEDFATDYSRPDTITAAATATQHMNISTSSPATASPPPPPRETEAPQPCPKLPNRRWICSVAPPPTRPLLGSLKDGGRGGLWRPWIDGGVEADRGRGGLGREGVGTVAVHWDDGGAAVGVTLCECDNDMSRKPMRILKKLRETDQSYYQLSHLVRQGEQPREGFFLLSNLVEDQAGGVNGYLEWILQIHWQIQQNA
ncbi:hypothetical protein RJ639_002887 [Escallonia herrerae]|uniref:Uncharacterized protein n=1 Tax=Escallonia herrerae TaxID=1293975 RepID=A0AA89AV85_9ASTE|nr:hypothetical protein RJ639_002887 [Escallonia herrerae]